MASSDNPQDIIDAAQRLIDQVHAQLNESNEALRRQGLDPEKVRAVASAQLTPQQADKAQTAYRSDLEAIEQEVQEELVRKSFVAPNRAAPAASTPVRRPRSMI